MPKITISLGQLVEKVDGTHLGAVGTVTRFEDHLPDFIGDPWRTSIYVAINPLLSPVGTPKIIRGAIHEFRPKE